MLESRASLFPYQTPSLSVGLGRPSVSHFSPNLVHVRGNDQARPEVIGVIGSMRTHWAAIEE